MIVFKTFLKVLNKNKFIVILYSAILIFFGAFNMQTSDSSQSFVSSKPDVLIVNQDEDKGITHNLIQYMEKHSKKIKVEKEEEAINDALFYRDINYVIYIPKNYREDFLSGKNPQMNIKSTGDYQASLAEMLLERYLNVASTYQKVISEEEKLIEKMNETLSKKVDIEVTSKLDMNNLQRASYYYSFANYSILAGCVYIICLVLASFLEENVKKRTVISSMKEKEFNRKLLLSNGLFAFVLWLLYAVVSFFLVGDIMFTAHGICYLINSFLFCFCALTLAFLIGNLIHNKNAINGIVNVVALGSSFLCGAFVPAEFLPDFVLKIAHLLPSYYYINSNELIQKIEVISLDTMQPVILNMIILLLFSILFSILANFFSNRKRKVG